MAKKSSQKEPEEIEIEEFDEEIEYTDEEFEEALESGEIVEDFEEDKLVNLRERLEKHFNGLEKYFDRSYKQTKILANRVRHLLDYYDGRIDGTWVKAILIEDETHTVEEDAETSQRFYRATLDFIIAHEEEL